MDERLTVVVVDVDATRGNRGTKQHEKEEENEERPTVSSSH